MEKPCPFTAMPLLLSGTIYRMGLPYRRFGLGKRFLQNLGKYELIYSDNEAKGRSEGQRPAQRQENCPRIAKVPTLSLLEGLCLAISARTEEIHLNLSAIPIDRDSSQSQGVYRHGQENPASQEES